MLNTHPSIPTQSRASAAFEMQKQNEEVTEAEAEELAVRKRRAEGTPCTLENFLAWQERFDKEMAEKEARDDENEDGKASRKKEKTKVVDKSGRQTGAEFFSNKANNLEALEAAAEAAGNEPMEDLDEDLFDVDDEDLDDLDFDDEEEEDLDI